MISFTVRLTFRPDDRDEILQILRELTRLSRQEPGCVSYVPHSVEGDPDTIVIYEQYRDTAAASIRRCLSARSKTSPPSPDPSIHPIFTGTLTQLCVPV
jgi:quinol monooxygenase YgiN